MFATIARELGLKVVCAVTAEEMLLACSDTEACNEGQRVAEAGPCPRSEASPPNPELLAPPLGCDSLTAVPPAGLDLRRSVVKMLSTVVEPERIWVVCVVRAPPVVDPMKSLLATEIPATVAAAH